MITTSLGLVADFIGVLTITPSPYLPSLLAGSHLVVNPGLPLSLFAMSRTASPLRVALQASRAEDKLSQMVSAIAYFLATISTTTHFADCHTIITEAPN